MFGFISARVAWLLLFGKRSGAASTGRGDVKEPLPFDGSSALDDGLAPTRLIFGSDAEEPPKPSKAPPARIAWHARDAARSRKIVAPVALRPETDALSTDATMLVGRVKHDGTPRRTGHSEAVHLPSLDLPSYDATVLVTARRRGAEASEG